MRRGHSINLLDEDPDLARTLGRERAGGSRPDADSPDEDGLLGLLVIDGLVLRRVEVGERTSLDVLGPGDLVRPFDSASAGFAMVPSETRWSVKEPTRVAVLDERFARAMSPYPEVVSSLCGRVAGKRATPPR